MKECTKVSFATEEEARTELRRIIETDYNPCPKRNTKPSRSYKCQWCGNYHLTSQSTITTY